MLIERNVLVAVVVVSVGFAGVKIIQHSAGRDPETRNKLGRGYLTEGQLDKAVAEFRKAIELKPDFAEAHNNLGLTYLRKERYPESLTSFRRALEIQPNLPQAQTNLGDMYAKGKGVAQDEAEALRWYRSAAQQRYARAHDSMAWLYATSKDPALRSLPLALEHANKAVELSQGNNADFLLTLAGVHYANGELDQAIAVLRRALALQPHDDFIKKQLQKWEEAKAAQADR